MTTTGLIATSDFCTYHHVEYTFVDLLNEAGLIEVRIIDQQSFIPEGELQKLERMIRLHHELDINVAGIGAITQLLQRVENMHEEMRVLRNRLRRYEKE